jgi:hypothetical protein
LELGGLSVIGDLIKLGSFYYCLTALNKASSKWSVVKIADGTVADDYVFFGANARASALNGKYSIVYDDIKAFTPIQKELYKTQKISIGASCLIIID